MIKKQLDKLIAESLAIENKNLKEAGSLGYMARALAQATIPHSKTPGNEFKRVNGNYTLTILSPSKIGLPYGTIPRILMAWITTEAVKTKQQTLILGDSLNAFLKELGLSSTGGRWGTIPRVRDQMIRLFSSSISCCYHSQERSAGVGFHIAKAYDLWWEPKLPNQKSLWQSTVTLGQDFFEEIVQNPIPIDLDTLKALGRSPLALDIYCWITYRMSYLKQDCKIWWSTLQAQFGANYATDLQGIRDFKKAFIRELKKVHLVYLGLRIEIEKEYLILSPSRTHIPKIVD